MNARLKARSFYFHVLIVVKAYSLECPPPRKSLVKGKRFIGSINSPWAKDQMLHCLIEQTNF